MADKPQGATMIRFRLMAGTADQAKHMANQMGLQPTEWKYVSKWEDLMGLKGGVMLMCSGWERRDDAHEIWDMAKQRNMNVLYIN